MNTPHAPLVLGATGKIGRRVVAGLRRRGLEPTLGSRTPGGPSARRFDWTVPSTWAPAVDGADAAFLSYAPDLAVPGAAEAVAELTTIAVAGGVRRIVLLSGRGEIEAERSEDAVRGIAEDWTIARSAWFAQNFSESFFLDSVLAGDLALPVDAVREPFVDADDVAEVAVAALLGQTEPNQLFEVTGPEMLTFAEAVAVISVASGRPLAFTSVPAQAYAQELRSAGLPDEVVDLIGYLFAEVLDGRNGHLSDGVQQALGRPPRSFADYARAAASTGVWDAAPAAVGR